VVSKGPAREGYHLGAGPCHNLKDANDLQEYFKPADEQDLLPILSPSFRNGKARKGLKGCEKMEHNRQRPGKRAASQRSFVTAF
jgi:hypothetical protein